MEREAGTVGMGDATEGSRRRHPGLAEALPTKRWLEASFASARAAYGDYLEDGRRFLHAERLRRINGQVRARLASEAHLLPMDLQPDVMALIEHFDVWSALWDDLRQQLKPGPADRFVFENSVTYPRASEERLMEFYTSAAFPAPGEVSHQSSGTETA